MPSPEIFLAYRKNRTIKEILWWFLHLHALWSAYESAMYRPMYRFHIFRHALQFPVPEIEHAKNGRVQSSVNHGINHGDLVIFLGSQQILFRRLIAANCSCYEYF